MKDELGPFPESMRSVPGGKWHGQPSEIPTARRKLWCDVWVAMARTEACEEVKIATLWADAAVKDFDERFGPKEVENS